MTTVLNGVTLNGTQLDFTTPAALFAAGEPGGWYDPSDTSTLFQDTTGTLPVTAVEQPVGLVLDKSQGLVLGPELVTNGTFASGTTGWVSGITYSATLAVSSGKLTVTTNSTNGFGCAIQSVSMTAGKTYRITGTRRSASSGNPAVGLGSGTGAVNTVLVTGSNSATTNDFSATFIYTTGSLILFNQTASNGVVSEFDNISIKEIAGNHLSQTTSTARPVLSARVNQFSYTEQFDNAYWTKSGTSIPVTNALNPFGELTADELREDTATSFHIFFRTYTFTAASHTVSVCAKANGRTKFNIGAGSTAVWGGDATFDLSAGTATANAGTASIQPLGSGWFRCSVTGVATAASTNINFVLMNAAGSVSYTGDGVSGIYIWGADLRVTNDGVGIPPYQRVGVGTPGSSSGAGSSDYNTTGFPLYLRFDGTDDFLVSAATVNFSTTAQISVFAGLRKQSDIAPGAIIEQGIPGTSTNNFWINSSAAVAGSGFPSTANYEFSLRGNVDYAGYGTTTFTAPITNIISVMYDLAASGVANEIKPRVNAIIPTLTVFTARPDAGPGNFGNLLLYIGRRTGTVNPFNGNIYSLIVRGAATSDTQIAQTNNYVNSKTKAY